MSSSHNTKGIFSQLTNFISIKTVLFLFFILPLVTCSLWGQVVQKKDLTPAQYSQWGIMSLEKVSPNNQWVSYNISYDNIIDTLFVHEVKNHKTYNYSSVQLSTFTKHNAFVCLNKEGLQIQDLTTGKKELIKYVHEFAYSSLTDNLIFIINPTNDHNKLIIRTPGGKIVKQINEINSYSLSPDNNHLVYSTSSQRSASVKLLALKNVNEQTSITPKTNCNSQGFTWQKEGKSLAFVAKSNEMLKTSLFYYTLQDQKLYELNPDTNSNFQKDSFISNEDSSNLTISDDMQRVFFNVKSKTSIDNSKETSTVEIWSTNDKLLFPEQVKNGEHDASPKVHMWIPRSEAIIQITTNEFPNLILSGDQQYAFLSNPLAYEPQIENRDGPRDIYIMNLATFTKKLFLTKHNASFLQIIPSPKGQYISYFQDRDWWIYDITTNTHSNITSKIKTDFKGIDTAFLSITMSEIAGWTNDDKEILLYDKYDLWAIKADGSSFKRLTRGRESQITYRIANIPNRAAITGIFDGLTLYNFDIKKELLLHGQGDDGKTGYFKWTPNLGAQTIIYDDKLIDQLVYTSKKQNWFYKEQKFNLSPQIMIKNKQLQPTAIFQSNPQQKKYYWGRSELIEYQNSIGKTMKGILYYPANFDPKKQYPMIVNIYQIQSKYLHKYKYPTSYTEDGFNEILWTTQGYFVLLPDITLEYQNPGFSALDCVTAATNKVLTKGIINPYKIGIMGHSLGGYEVSFISSQTNLFTTAIAGGAITDLYSYYFTLGRDLAKGNMWRFTGGQWDIKQTPFEIPEVYYKNSPISHADKINIPLLLWTGKNDGNVDPHQTMELYLALRTLRKKSIMLIYSDEGHSIMKPANQKDFTDRVQAWFAYFLKDDLSAKWVTEGLK
jgi:dipeptidyl aminopeptidase/acylaminoacyl peptidase